MAVVQYAQCGGQLDREAVVGGESVCGVRGWPADRGVGQRDGHRREPGDDQYSPRHPLAQLQCSGRGAGQSSEHDDDA